MGRGVRRRRHDGGGRGPPRASLDDPGDERRELSTPHRPSRTGTSKTSSSGDNYNDNYRRQLTQPAPAVDKPPAHRTSLWTAPRGVHGFDHRSPADAYGLTRFACQTAVERRSRKQTTKPLNFN